MSELVTHLIEVRLMGHGGLDLLTLSSSHFDPKQTQDLGPSHSVTRGYPRRAGQLSPDGKYAPFAGNALKRLGTTIIKAQR